MTTIENRTDWTLHVKVPVIITIYFWAIKIMATTVGETGADFLSANLHLGLANTTWVMSTVLAVVLAVQLASRRYRPWLYWLTVVFVSVVGTLITDNLTDRLGVPLELSTAAFAVALAATFLWWHASERTLSIHSVVTVRRELFYWAAILFTFALGTAWGDLLAERLAWGFGLSAIVFGSAILAVVVAYFRFDANPILSFWVAYVLTRPFGASLGDLLAQPADAGGLGLGTVVTSAVFLVVILGLVAYLARTGRDIRPTTPQSSL